MKEKTTKDIIEIIFGLIFVTFWIYLGYNILVLSELLVRYLKLLIAKG